MIWRRVSDFESWRSAARDLVDSQVAPEDIRWQDASDPQAELPLDDLAETRLVGSDTAASDIRVPRAFMELARHVACYRNSGRWALLYSVLWRLAHVEPRLLKVEVDEHVHALRQMELAIRRDIHKMHAFVRFEKRAVEGRDEYLAYYRPDHRIFRLAMPFFVDRFGSMRWTILGPDETATWDGEQLVFTAGVAPGITTVNSTGGTPNADRLTELWQSYYAATFNPARLNVRQMRREMPARFWPLLPEVADVDRLIQRAPSEAEQLVAAGARTSNVPLSARPYLPPGVNLNELALAARVCQGCPLYASATQTVFGEGPPDAPIVFVGEQPGDQEDFAGRPFVGPAGQIFDDLLAEAGIHRDQAYVTNTVKHFKWVERGKRRLHAKPSSREIHACRPWLEAELEAIRPQALMLLGATAAQALLGPQFRVQRERGRPRSTSWSSWTIATYHPSAILRARDAAHALHIRESMLADLRLTAAQLKQA